MSPKRTEKFVLSILKQWTEADKPKEFRAVCPICGKPVDVKQTRLVFSAKCRGCGEEV